MRDKIEDYIERLEQAEADYARKGIKSRHFDSFTRGYWEGMRDSAQAAINDLKEIVDKDLTND